jgi:hypothetical protein
MHERSLVHDRNETIEGVDHREVLGPFEDHREALPDTDAHRAQRVAALASLEFTRGSEREARRRNPGTFISSTDWAVSRATKSIRSRFP